MKQIALKKNLKKKTLAVAVAMALGGSVVPSWVYAWEYQFRHHQFEDTWDVAIDVATGVAVGKVIGKGISSIPGATKEQAEGATLIMQAQLSTTGMGDALNSSIAEVIKNPLGVKTAYASAQTFDIPGAAYQDIAHEKDFAEKISDTVRDWYVKPFAAITAKLGETVRFVPSVKAADVMATAALTLDGRNQAMDETRYFYLNAINEIIYSYQAMARHLDNRIEHKNIDDYIRNDVTQFDNTVAVMIEHLKTHKANLKNNYTAGVNIGHGIRTDYLKWIDEVINALEGSSFKDTYDEYLLSVPAHERPKTLKQITDTWDMRAAVFEEYEDYLGPDFLGRYKEHDADGKNLVDDSFDLAGKYIRGEISYDQNQLENVTRGLIMDYLANQVIGDPRGEQNQKPKDPDIPVNPSSDSNARALGYYEHSWRAPYAPDAFQIKKTGDTLTLISKSPLIFPDLEVDTKIGFGKVEGTKYSSSLDFRYMNNNQYQQILTMMSNDGDFYSLGVQGFYGIPDTFHSITLYSGHRLQNNAALPATGISVYHMSYYDMLGWFESENNYLSGINRHNVNHELFINWKSGKVYGLYHNPQQDVFDGSDRILFFIGDVDRDTLELRGHNVYLHNHTRFLFETDRALSRNFKNEQVSLQLYGKNYPNGIGGLFDIAYGLSSWPSQRTPGTAMLIGHLAKKSAVERPYVPGNNWQGFATGIVVDQENKHASLAYNTDRNTVRIRLQPSDGTVSALINVGEGDDQNTRYTLTSDSDDLNVYVKQDAFAIVTDDYLTPSYVVTTMLEDSGYDHLSWGRWGKDQLEPTKNLEGAHWIAGRLTPTVSMPATGTASYTGIVRGSGVRNDGLLLDVAGTSNLTANFGAGTVEGHLFLGPTLGTASLQGVSISGNQLSGNLHGNQINTGNIHGAFYGPQAQEMGGNWAVKANQWQATGIFTGKR